LLEVTFQGSYQWHDRQESNRVRENRQLSSEFEKIFIEHDGNYGSPRITTELHNRGFKVNHKRVERIMRDMGLVGKAAKLCRRKARPERFFMKHPNHKLNMLTPSKINQQWAGDITYFKVNGNWSYLAVVMALYSRRILVWSLGVK